VGPRADLRGRRARAQAPAAEGINDLEPELTYFDPWLRRDAALEKEIVEAAEALAGRLFSGAKKRRVEDL
jgi:hypothetical protein